MAEVTSAPTTHYDFFSTTLKRSMTSASQKTGIVLNAITDNEGNARTLTSTPIILRFSRANKQELVSAGGWTQDADGNFTLTDVRRNLDEDDPTSYAEGSRPVKWSAGTRIENVIDGRTIGSVARTNVDNSFSATQTFNAPVEVTGTSSYVQVPSLTTVQRDALTAANGMIIYNSDDSVLQQRVGGSWSDVGTSSVPNASDNTSGKVDIASASEIGAGTATDATSGAINVIPVSQTAKTSSGAGDENKLPILGSSGTLAIGFLATGSADGTKFVKDDGTLATPTFSQDVTAKNSRTSTSSAVGASTTSEVIVDSDTVDGGELNAGDEYEYKILGEYSVASGSLTLRTKFASSTLMSIGGYTSTNQAFYATGHFVCRTSGASGTCSGGGMIVAENATADMNALESFSVDTTANQDFELAAQFSASHASNSVKVFTFQIKKLNAPS